MLREAIPVGISFFDGAGASVLVGIWFPTVRVWGAPLPYSPSGDGCERVATLSRSPGGIWVGGVLDLEELAQMKFWFNLHPTREEAKVLKERAVAFLAARGSEAVEDPREADLAAHQACARPIIGVNAGTLGYLPRIEPEQLEEAFGRILAGDYALESRMTLSAGERGGETVNALNDVALTKADPGVLRFTVSVDGVELMRYTADGIICATPTGSTGYSLSAGGPIVDPLSELFVLTPIAPHTLVSRPVILSDKGVVTLTPDSDALISIDGRVRPIRAGTSFDIRKAETRVQFVTLGSEGFIDRLRRKLS